MSRSDPSILYLSCLASGKWQVVRPRPVAYPERRIPSPDSLQLPPKQYLSLCKEDRSHRMFPQPATMVKTARNRSDVLNNLLALCYTRSFERDVFFPRTSHDHKSRIHTLVSFGPEVRRSFRQSPYHFSLTKSSSGYEGSP